MAVDKNELILKFQYQAQRANAGIDKTNKKIGGLWSMLFLGMACFVVIYDFFSA